MNVVFDFGGVLFEWSPVQLLQSVLPQRQPDEALVASFFQGYGGDWGEFDRGTVEPDVLAGRIAARTGLRRDEVQAVIDAVPAALRPIEGTVALLARLRERGRTLRFLSNMPEPYARHLEATHDFLAHFHDGVFSARVGMIKPERAIFEHARERFGLEPAQMLFIDDHPANVTAAREAGWQALHFQSPAQCEAELARRGLL